MLIPFWPYERWDGVYIAVLIAAVVQLVSPWNESAAAYAQYIRASEKQRRKAKSSGLVEASGRVSSARTLLARIENSHYGPSSAVRYGIGLQ